MQMKGATGLAIAALVLWGLTLLQFRFDLSPAAAAAIRGEYTIRDRWTGQVWLCSGPGCVQLKTTVLRAL